MLEQSLISHHALVRINELHQVLNVEAVQTGQSGCCLSPWRNSEGEICPPLTPFFVSPISRIHFPCLFPYSRTQHDKVWSNFQLSERRIPLWYFNVTRSLNRVYAPALYSIQAPVAFQRVFYDDFSNEKTCF